MNCPILLQILLSHKISPILNGGIAKSQAIFLGGDGYIYGVNFAQILVPPPAVLNAHSLKVTLQSGTSVLYRI